MSGYVFISYSRADALYVQRLVAHLRAAGIEAWVDTGDRGIGVGDRWINDLLKRLEGSSAVIVVMSAAAQESEWVTNELDKAREDEKPIFPLVLSERLFQLRHLHHDDVRSEDGEGRMPGPDFIERLRRVLDLPAETAATPAPVVDDVAAPEDPADLLGSSYVRPTRHDWVSYAGPGGRLVFDIRQGTVCSSRVGSTTVREWPALGREVTSLVATQDGSYLATQSADGIVIGKLEPGDFVKPIIAVPADGEIELLAARYRRAVSAADFPAYEILVGTPSGSQIWAIRSTGRRVQDLAFACRAAAGTEDGFLVVLSTGELARAAFAQPEPVSLNLGGGWLDIDVSVGLDETIYGGLRTAAGAVVASKGFSVRMLLSETRPYDYWIEAIRVDRCLGYAAPHDQNDQEPRAWLLSDARPLAFEPLTQGEAHVAHRTGQHRPDIFLSYSSTFRSIARDMYDRLQSQGLSVWFAPEDIDPGSWREQLQTAIAISASYVILWGEGSDRELTQRDIRDPRVMQWSEIQRIVRTVDRGRRPLYVYVLDRHPALPPALERNHQLEYQAEVAPDVFAADVRKALDEWNRHYS